MSEFVAGAFVDVRPDTKGFRNELKRKVNASVESMGSFKIPVELDPKRFKSTVAAAARQSPARVPIVPGTSVADLRKAIKDKIDKAVAGLKIKVPVEVEAKGPVKTPKETATRTERTTRRTERTQVSGTEEASKRSERATTKLTAAEQRLAAVNNALKKAEKELAIATRLSAQALQGSITAEERATRLREARAATSRAAKAVNEVLATSEDKLSAKQRKALEATLATAHAERTKTTEKQKSAKIDASKQQLQERNIKLEAKTAEVMGVEIKSIKELNRLHAVENELTAVEARLKTSANKARDLGVQSVVNTNDKLLREIQLRKDQIVLQRAELKGEGARVRQQKTAARGFGATVLSLLGVRGATLAANTAFLAGAAGAALFAKALGSFAQFETELNVFQATAGATADQMKEVSRVAVQLGTDITLPGVTAADAAQAMSELSRAGLSVRDSIAGARGVLELAAAAQLSNADAATLAASALNAFGLEGDQAIHVADLLANAANASQGSIEEMGAALQQASAVARQVGFSLENTVATLTLFARNGLRGSDAGTSLRTALSRLIAPTKDASDLIASLGLNLRDTQGRLRPDIFVQFGEATKNLSPALRDMIAQTIAGQDAIRAFSIGAREGSRGLKLAQLQMEATGTAAALAAARSKGLGGEFRALGSNVQTLGTEMGAFAAGPVKQAVTQINALFTALNQLITLDFGALVKGAESDFNQAIENMKRHGEGLFKVFNPGSSFDDVRRGLTEIFTPAPKDNKIAALQEALARLQALRVQSFEVGANIGPITKQIKDIRAQLKAAKVDAGLIIPVTALEKQLAPLREARKVASDLKSEILADNAGADVTFLDDLIANFNARIKLVVTNARTSAKNAKKAMQEELSGTDIAKSFEAQFKLIARQPDLATPEVLAGLQDLARKIKGTAPLTGAAGAQVGKSLMKSINAAISKAVAEDNPDLAASLKQLAAKIANLFGTSISEAFKNVKVPLTEEQILDSILPQRVRAARAEAFGTVTDQINAKQAELDALKKALGKVEKGSAEEEKLLNDIAAKQNEIESLRESQANDRKERIKKADQKVLDAANTQEQRLLNRLTKAQADESLKNDIRAQLALRGFYQRQIAHVKATVRDDETRRDQLEELNQKLFEIDQDIADSRRGRRSQVRDAALKKIDDAAERASETETLADDLNQARRRVRFWKAQVKIIKKLVEDRKATADELKEAQGKLDDAEKELRQATRARRDQRKEQRQESLELDIQFAQITENRNAEIRARQLFIKWLEEQKRAAKGNINKIKELRNQIAEQKKAIKELNDEAKDKQGTTAFELLQQAAETFRQNAGTLIGGNQPFAGPTGFTADLAQFLRRQQRAASAGLTPINASTLPLPIPPQRVTGPDRTDFSRLTGALDRLANVIERTPGTGTVTSKLPAGVQRSERNHFSTATASRRVVEERSNF